MTTDRAVIIVGVAGWLIGATLVRSEHEILGFSSMALAAYLIGWGLGPWPRHRR